MLIMSNITKEEYEYLKDFDFNKNYIDFKEQNELLKIYNRIYNTNRKRTKCHDCWVEIVFMIKRAYDSSKHLFEKKKK